MRAVLYSIALIIIVILLAPGPAHSGEWWDIFKLFGRSSRTAEEAMPRNAPSPLRPHQSTPRPSNIPSQTKQGEALRWDNGPGPVRKEPPGTLPENSLRDTLGTEARERAARNQEEWGIYTAPALNQEKTPVAKIMKELGVETGCEIVASSLKAVIRGSVLKISRELGLEPERELGLEQVAPLTKQEISHTKDAIEKLSDELTKAFMKELEKSKNLCGRKNRIQQHFKAIKAIFRDVIKPAFAMGFCNGKKLDVCIEKLLFEPTPTRITSPNQ